jgi:hypothetical protein
MSNIPRAQLYLTEAKLAYAKENDNKTELKIELHKVSFLSLF